MGEDRQASHAESPVIAVDGRLWRDEAELVIFLKLYWVLDVDQLNLHQCMTWVQMHAYNRTCTEVRGQR